MCLLNFYATVRVCFGWNIKTSRHSACHLKLIFLGLFKARCAAVMLQEDHLKPSGMGFWLAPCKDALWVFSFGWTPQDIFAPLWFSCTRYSKCIYSTYTCVCMTMQHWAQFYCAGLFYFFFFSSLCLRQTGQAGQGHRLRGVLEKCSSAVGEQKYERDPKSRHRTPWIMSAAELKKKDGTICSSIWMANWLTTLLTQAEEVWRGCKD